MANFEYLISEAYIHEYKDSPGTRDFALSAGINLDIISKAIKPTKKHILEIFESQDYKVEITIIGTDLYQVLAKKENIDIWLELSDCLNEDTGLGMIKIGRGTNFFELINLVKSLIPITGNYLYYCDSGMMSLITLEKDTKTIINELGFKVNSN